MEGRTCEALQRLRRSGRRLILVTGRDLPDLKRVLPQTALFDRIVAENGALIYNPATDVERAIAPPPPANLIEALRRRNVTPLSVGRSIVATWEPHGAAVLEVLRDLGLEHHIVFNKGAVMVLPRGVDKASGLATALRELALSAVNVVGVGDAQNDHAFLQSCGRAAAVANALPSVKDDADIQLSGDHGQGVIELVDMICSDDPRLVPSQRYRVPVAPIATTARSRSGGAGLGKLKARDAADLEWRVGRVRWPGRERDRRRLPRFDAADGGMLCGQPKLRRTRAPEQTPFAITREEGLTTRTNPPGSGRRRPVPDLRSIQRTAAGAAGGPPAPCDENAAILQDCRRMADARRSDRRPARERAGSK